MISLKPKAYGLAALIGVMAGVGSANIALAQEEPPRGWFKACTKQEDVDVCNVQFLNYAPTGQILTSLNLIEVKGKVNRRVLQIVVPTGRIIPPGIGLQIDGGTTQKVEYAMCVQDRCIAEAPLSDEIVNAFKRGTELTLTSVNFQNQPNPIKVTLQGFTGAYDGPPLQQGDLDDRKKKLEEFVSKNNEEYVQKLKEAQEQAKQSQ